MLRILTLCDIIFIRNGSFSRVYIIRLCNASGGRQGLDDWFDFLLLFSGRKKAMFFYERVRQGMPNSKMFRPVVVGKKKRYTYARSQEVLKMPHLLDLQTKSYEW